MWCERDSSSTVMSDSRWIVSRLVALDFRLETLCGGAADRQVQYRPGFLALDASVLQGHAGLCSKGCFGIELTALICGTYRGRRAVRTRA